MIYAKEIIQDKFWIVKDDNINDATLEKKEDKISELPKAQYHEWKISPKLEISTGSLSHTITSKIFTLFGIKWYLMLVPRKNPHCQLSVYLCVTQLPLNVTDLSIFCKLINCSI